MQDQTKTLHHHAEELREQGNSLEALKLYEEVILAYQQVGNYRDLADALRGRFLTYKNLFWQSGDVALAHIAIAQVNACLQICLDHHLPVDGVYFSLGEAHMLFGAYQSAIQSYTRSLEASPPAAHIGRIRYHLGVASYRAGEKEHGLTLLKQGLDEIRTHAYTLGDYIGHVWESGCHLNLAELLAIDDPAQSHLHLTEARRIIDADSRLIIRKRQLRALETRLLKG